MKIKSLIGLAVFAVGLYYFSNFELIFGMQKTGIVLIVAGLAIALLK